MSDSEPQPLLPIIDHMSTPPSRELLDYIQLKTGRVMNLHRVMAYAPELMRASFDLIMALRHRTSIPIQLSELCILRTAQLAKSGYVWEAHNKMALSVGVTSEKIEQVANWRNSEAYNEAERCALGFAEAVFIGQTPSAAEATALRSIFTAQEIVELAQLVSQYLATARVIGALAIPRHAIATPD